MITFAGQFAFYSLFYLREVNSRMLIVDRACFGPRSLKKSPDRTGARITSSREFAVLSCNEILVNK